MNYDGIPFKIIVTVGAFIFYLVAFMAVTGIIK